MTDNKEPKLPEPDVIAYTHVGDNDAYSRAAMRAYGQQQREEGATAREAYLMQSHAGLMDAASAMHRIEKAEAERDYWRSVAEKEKSAVPFWETNIFHGIPPSGYKDWVEWIESDVKDGAFIRAICKDDWPKSTR